MPFERCQELRLIALLRYMSNTVIKGVYNFHAFKFENKLRIYGSLYCLRGIGIEIFSQNPTNNMKHDKMLDPMSQAWLSGSASAA